MNASLLVSVSLGIAWVLAVGLGAAILAMAHHIGDRYAYTAMGISRMGPRAGQRLASTITFMYRGEKFSLRQVVSQEYPTLIVFLNAYGTPSSLVHDLLKFTSLFQDELKALIFCKGPCERIGRLSDVDHALKVVTLEDADNQLYTDLGIRVQPYALLLDKRMTLVGKGLVNNFQHLCWLVAASEQYLEPGELVNVMNTCRPQYIGEIHNLRFVTDDISK